jgi:hypothetical protein
VENKQQHNPLFLLTENVTSYFNASQVCLPQIAILGIGALTDYE